MKPLVLLCLACAASWAQVSATVRPLSRQSVAAIFNSRIARKVTIWNVILENQSSETVQVWEAAVLRRVPGINAHSQKTVGFVVLDGQQFSWEERVARLAADGSQGAAFLGTGKVVRMSSGWVAGLTAASFLFQYLPARLKGIERPAVSNLAALAWVAPAVLAPGAADTRYVFSERWTGEPGKAFEVVIDTSKLPPARVAQ